MFLSPGHWWAGPPVADTAHGAGVHGTEAGSSYQTVPPDWASKSCFLCTICQLTALLHSFLSSSLFPVFFNRFSLFKGFSSPISFFFSENKWSWKHWELIRRGKKNKHKKETSYKWNYFFCTCKAHGKTAGISPREPLQPIAQWCKASMDQVVSHQTKPTSGRHIPKKGQTFPGGHGLSRTVSRHKHLF